MKPIDIIASAIRSADTSYFNEDYSKQARAVLAALEKHGLQVMPKEYPDALWQQVAESMRTGRLRPDEHVKNVYETVLRIAGATASAR